MEKLLSGKTCLITGASKGIGREIADLFAYNGANLILLSKNKSKLDKSAISISKKNPQRDILSLYCDIGNPDSINFVFQEIRNHQLKIDTLVNNAGIMIDGLLGMTNYRTIDEIIRVNLLGSILITQHASKFMIKNRSGSIINLTSIIGSNGSSGQSVYSASKSGLIGFTKSMAKELAPYQIRVNAISPGFIQTDMTKGRDEKFYEKNLLSIGMRRFGNPSDVANVALFLSSSLSEYVTGQIVGVDGGMII